MHSIRWKLILMTSLVVFLPVYFLNRKAVQAFDRFTSHALEAEMIGFDLHQRRKNLLGARCHRSVSKSLVRLNRLLFTSMTLLQIHFTISARLNDYQLRLADFQMLGKNTSVLFFDLHQRFEQPLMKIFRRK